MPEIQPNDIKSQEWLKSYNMNRWVRLGEKFFYSTDYKEPHSKIAIDNGAQISASSEHKPLVGDAGDIHVVEGKIFFGGSTTSCEVVGDELQARIKTNEVAKKQFGEEFIYPFAA